MAIRRYFIDWNQPILPAAADYIIDRYATDKELDLSNVVLVFTGRRASRRMLELLLEKASPKWPAFLPPRMVTFQRFPELLYPQQKQMADDLTQLLVWKKAIAQIRPAELKAALPSIPDDDAVPSWLSLCESLRAQHNELAEEGMDFDAIYRAHANGGNRDEADRWKALLRIQAEYLVQMDELNLWDRETSRLFATEQKECVADFDVMLIGTVDISQVVRPMLDQIEDRVTAVIHAPESEAAAFDEHGGLMVDAWTDRLLNIDPESTQIANDPGGQGDIVIQEIASLNGSRSADEISIGIADDSLVPAVMQKLSDTGIEGRWPIGMKMRDTRPWRLLDGLAQHLATARDGQPPDFASLLDFVRHPDVTDFVQSTVQQTCGERSAPARDWLTELDRYTTLHLQRSPGVLLGSSPRRKVIGAVIAAVDQLLAAMCPVGTAGPTDVATRTQHVSATNQRQQQFEFESAAEVVIQSTQHQLESRQPLKGWIDGVLRLLGIVYGSRTLDLKTRSDRGIMECCAAFTELAETLTQIPEAVIPVCTASQALQLVLRETADQAIPPEANDSAVELLGWLEVAMDDAPVLLLTGFNEGFVPESMTSDVFLPNSFRSRLGLKDNRRRYARDAYAMTTILHSRERVTFVAGRADAKGNPLTPSRLWFAADPDSLADRIQRFYDVEEATATAADPAVEAEADAESAAAAADSTSNAGAGFIIPPPAQLPPVPTEIAVTAFREYLDCPYRYVLKRELKLRHIEDETLELSAPAFGSLIHDVLNLFGQSDYAEATSREAIEQFLLQALQSLATKRFGRNRTATVSVQLQMIQNRMTAFSHWQAKTAAEGWRILHTEEDLKYEDFKDAQGRPIVLAGRVDRIDQHQRTKQWRVLDYKTSERAEKPEATHFKKKAWVDLQLPLYRLLVKSLGIETDVQLGYIHLPGDLTNIGASIAKWGQNELEDAEQVARQVAADIIDLKIDRVAPGQEHRNVEFARVCQDSVIDRSYPWLSDWSGRS